MKKAFTLPTCKTCQRIFDDLQPAQHGCDVIDIKAEGISAEDLDAMKAYAGSYEALFSRRAMLTNCVLSSSLPSNFTKNCSVDKSTAAWIIEIENTTDHFTGSE